MIIELEKITKTFTNGRHTREVLKGIDLKLEQGTELFILGPSGSGKTTLLNILGLIEHPDNGSHLLNNSPVDEKSEKEKALIRRKKIGYIYQNFNLISYLNLLDNILLPFLPEEKIPGLKEQALSIMERLDIVSLRDQYPLSCSGGEKQRAVIARALLKEPELLLADEPTGELDEKNSRRIMELLREYRGRTTLVIVSHNENLIRGEENKIELKDGKLLWP